MMGRQVKGQQVKMFYHGFCLEQRVRPDHPLRKINRLIDFDFSYKEVMDTYGKNGNVSVPPPVVLKLMFLLFFYNVRSERELVATVPERLDWAWFLGLDLNERVPDHSVLSKARARWGSDLFERFFQKIVIQCVNAGLVDGSKIFMDSSLVQADASKNSIVKAKSFRRRLKRGYRELEARLDGQDEGSQDQRVNSTHLSTTDPDASIVSKGATGSRLAYKVNRAVEEKSEVITATEVTPGAVNEAHLLGSLIEGHNDNTGREAEIVVADTKYGTAQNYLECHDRGIAAHIPSLKESHGKKGIFPNEAFSYDSENDTFLCPAGNRLKCARHDKKNDTFEYRCLPRLCEACSLRDKCTKSKQGRSLRRHRRHNEIEKMREKALLRESKQDIRIRQHLMERSFARAVRLGFKRCRWRGLIRAAIQEYLTATVQNIMILVQNVKEPKPAMPAEMKQEAGTGGRERKSLANGPFCRLIGAGLAFLSSLFRSRSPLASFC